MKGDLSRSAQMQFMRPGGGQLEAAAKAFPVVYVPSGLIEWHGRHLPLGNDALKAHAFLVKVAQAFPLEFCNSLKSPRGLQTPF